MLQLMSGKPLKHLKVLLPYHTCTVNLPGLYLQYSQIDEEHKGLFQGIFKCAASPNDAGALSSLAALVSAHFVYEEVSFM